MSPARYRADRRRLLLHPRRSAAGRPRVYGRRRRAAADGRRSSEAFAQEVPAGPDAVGKRMALGRNQPLDICRWSAWSPMPSTATPPTRSCRNSSCPIARVDTGLLTFYVRSATSGAPLFPAITGIVKGLDSALPVERLRTMDDQVDTSIAPYRVVTVLSSTLGGAGHGAGRDWLVWRAGPHRGQARPGVRHPHGTRCASRGRRSAGAWPRRAHRRHQAG